MQSASRNLGAARDESLDGLRGLASLSVFVFHFLATFFPASVGGNRSLAHHPVELAFYDSPLWFLTNGDFAVSIFFVLSGYVLTADFFTVGDRRTIYRRAIGRIVRLGIPAAASIVFVAGLLEYRLYFLKDISDITGAGQFFNAGGLFNFSPKLETILSESLVTTWFTALPAEKTYNPVLWTMQVELWGSMIVFLLAAVLANVRARVVVIVVLSLSLAAVGGTLLTVRLGAFALGSAVAASGMKRSSWRGWIALAGASCLLGSYNAVPAFSMPAVCVHSLAAIMLLCSVIKSRQVARALSCRPLAYLGRVSFSLYLVHQPVIYSVGAWVFLRTLGSVGYSGAASVALACVVVASFLIAHFAEAWIDRPAAALSRSIGSGVIGGLVRIYSVSIRIPVDTSTAQLPAPESADQSR